MPPDNWSLEFDGTNNIHSTTSGTLASFDIANSWSVMVAVKPDTVSGNHIYFHISDNSSRGDTDNTIEIKAIVTKIRITIDSSIGYGSNFKVYDYNSAIVADVWHQFLLTWDGTTLILYKNGAALVADTKVVDGALTQTASVDKALILSGNDKFVHEMSGRIHSAAVWSVVLDAGAITDIWNSGTINIINLKTDFGSYSSSGDLQHWYQLGFDPISAGKDFGISSTLIDLTGTEFGPIRVTDSPGA